MVSAKFASLLTPYARKVYNRCAGTLNNYCCKSLILFLLPLMGRLQYHLFVNKLIIRSRRILRHLTYLSSGHFSGSTETAFFKRLWSLMKTLHLCIKLILFFKMFVHQTTLRRGQYAHRLTRESKQVVASDCRSE
jgi:hypothetical protein